MKNSIPMGTPILSPKRVTKSDPATHRKELEEARAKKRYYTSSRRAPEVSKRRKANKIAKQSRKRNRS
jgi:hypothetical protein